MLPPPTPPSTPSTRGRCRCAWAGLLQDKARGDRLDNNERHVATTNATCIQAGLCYVLVVARGGPLRCYLPPWLHPCNTHHTCGAVAVVLRMLCQLHAVLCAVLCQLHAVLCCEGCAYATSLPPVVTHYTATKSKPERHACRLHHMCRGGYLPLRLCPCDTCICHRSLDPGVVAVAVGRTRAAIGGSPS